MSEPQTPSTSAADESDYRKSGVHINDDFGFPSDAFLIPLFYKPYIKRVLLPTGLLQDRIQKMAFDILQDRPKDRPLYLLCVLKSASVFHFKLSEQLRKLAPTSLCPIYFEEFVRVSSYSDTHSGNVTISGLQLDALEGKDVLLIEDMVDTGKTLATLTKALWEARVASLKVATLLVKRTGQNLFSPDYVGFSVPDEFVVGFGIDYNQHFRDVAPLCIVNKEGEAAFASSVAKKK